MSKLKLEDHIKTEYVEVQITHKLRKDIKLNEEICPDCKGLGVGIRHANYGVTVDGQKLGDGWFPFDKESIMWCHSCYNGVRKRCNHCNELVDKRWVECQCEKSLESRGKARWQVEKAKWEKAKKISYSEAINTYEMVYVDYLDKYIRTDDLADEMQIYLDDNDCMDLTEEDFTEWNIYGTSTHSVLFDAGNILENATEDMHEEAYERSKHVIEKFQGYLDEIANEIKNNTTTYFINYKIGIQLTKEDVDGFKLEFK